MTRHHFTEYADPATELALQVSCGTKHDAERARRFQEELLDAIGRTREAENGLSGVGPHPAFVLQEEEDAGVASPASGYQEQLAELCCKDLESEDVSEDSVVTRKAA